MEWIERLNESLLYIEEHLTDEIDYEQLGRIACCSAYHYQRMFTYMAGVTLSEYIRRRKMSLAAVDLQGTDAKVIDIPDGFQQGFPGGLRHRSLGSENRGRVRENLSSDHF